jgi:hypothetical protein
MIWAWSIKKNWEYRLGVTEFAKSMNEDAWALRWMIEERIDGLMERKSA